MRYGQKRLQISKNIHLMKLKLLTTKFSWSFLKKQTIPDKTQWMGGKCVFIVAWESSSLSPYVNTLQSMMLFLRKSEMNIKFQICWRNVSGLLIFRLYTKICRLSFPVFFSFFTCGRWMVKSSKNIRASKLLHFGDSTKCEW